MTSRSTPADVQVEHVALALPSYDSSMTAFRLHPLIIDIEHIRCLLVNELKYCLH